MIPGGGGCLETLEGRLEITFGVDEEIAIHDNLFALRYAAEDFDQAVPFAPKLDVARFIAAVALIDKHDLAGSTIDDSARGNRKSIILASGRNFDIAIHVGQQGEIGVWHFNPHAHSARILHQVRKNEAHIA